MEDTDNKKTIADKITQTVSDYRSYKQRVSQIYAEQLTLLNDLNQKTPQRFFTNDEHEMLSSLLSKNDTSIVVIGQTRSGKSTLLNSILGVPDLFPVAEVPCTARLVQMVYSEKKFLAVKKSNGSQVENLFPISDEEEVLPEELQEEITLLSKSSDRTDEAVTGLMVEVGWPHALLKSGVVLVDAPGEKILLDNEKELLKMKH